MELKMLENETNRHDIVYAIKFTIDEFSFHFVGKLSFSSRVNTCEHLKTLLTFSFITTNN